MTTPDLDRLVADLPSQPRVVVSGNAATPWTLLHQFNWAVDTYVLHQLNPQVGVPDRPGVTLETPFVGPGARHSSRLSYLPRGCRRSRCCTQVGCLPTSYCCTRRCREGTVSLGTEVNVLPAAIEAARKRGGLVVAQVDPAMPYVYGDGELPLAWMDFTMEATDPPGSPAPPVVETPPGGCAERRSSHRGRSNDPDRHRQHPRRRAVWAPGPQGSARLERDDQRRRPGPGEGRQPRPGGRHHLLLPVRHARTLRVGGPQSSVAPATHRGHQRPERRSAPTTRWCR